MSCANPYRIEGPALISFSGGRTSAFMLFHILQAHDGQLPDDVHVVFANTGKEREETLQFVQECGSRWGVNIRWVEWMHRKRGSPWSDGFVEVGFNSASRQGEPLDRVFAHRGAYLPNSQTRFCTIDSKIRTMRNFMRDQGFENWKNVIGLRADEMLRVFKAIERNEAKKDPWVSVMPMASRAANVREADVLEFWQRQEFDLQLRSFEGNCDLCFLKARGKLMHLIREDPSRADWWIAQEQRRQENAEGLTSARAANFREGETFAQLRDAAINSPELPLFDDEEHDAECGLICAGFEA